MGLTYAQVEIENTFNKRAMSVKALVDSGAVFFMIPEHMAVQLGFDLAEASTREVILADGHRQTVPMIGPLRVHCGNDGPRSASCDADSWRESGQSICSAGHNEARKHKVIRALLAACLGATAEGVTHQTSRPKRDLAL